MLTKSPAVRACLAAGCLAAGCTQAPPAATALRVWAHEGRQAEREVLQHQIARFNQSHPGLPIQLTFLPEGGYNSQIQAAALARELPDLLEFDGPFVYGYAWQGCLQPLERQLAPATLENLLPTLKAQGSYDGHLYSVGNFDSGLALYGRKSWLNKVAARLPRHPREAWTVREFDEIMTRLSRLDPDGQVLDLKLNYRGEWFTYGFAPLLESAGAGLFSEKVGQAQGWLDSAPSVRVLTALQGWIQAGRVDPNLDDDAFCAGRVCLSWAGHWEYPRYSARWGNDLILLPLPDFGRGSRTAQGSWNWGVTKNCQQVGAACQFLEFLLEDHQVLEMTSANGAVPATRSAIQRSPLYGQDGPCQLFAVQLAEGYAVVRPRTAAYPVITSVFQHALRDVLQGGEVPFTLRWAAQCIDSDVAENRGYR